MPFDLSTAKPVDDSASSPAKKGFDLSSAKPVDQASASSSSSGDGRIHIGAEQDSEHMSTPEYIIDQVDRAPFKALDFLLHGLSGGSEASTFKALSPEQQRQYLKSHPNPEGNELNDPVNFGSRMATKLLGPEPKPVDWKQAILGAGAGAAAGGGPTGLKGAAVGAAFGGAQEAAVQGLTALGVSREKADAIVMALGIGGTVAAGKIANNVGKGAAEKAAVDKTKDYVAQREAVNQTATPDAQPSSTQAALAAAKKDAQATFDARDKAAEATQKAAERHVENTVAAFQPGSNLADIAQPKLSEFQDKIRSQAAAEAQGTLQNVFKIQRVDVAPAIAEARRISDKFAGNNAVSSSADGVAQNIAGQTKEMLGKPAAGSTVGSGKVTSQMAVSKAAPDTATVSGEQAHNLVNDLNNRIAGKGEYATNHTPDVKNLITIRDKLIESIDKASGGAYTKYRQDYGARLAQLDPFQKGQTAGKLVDDLEYGRMTSVGKGQAAEMLLPKGAKGGDTAARIQSVMGKDPEFQQAVTSYVGQKLSDLKASPGGLTPQKFAQFQRDYGPAMKAYGVDVSTVQDAVQAAAVREAEVAAIRKTTQTQRDQYNNSALAKAAGVPDASLVLDPIMQGDRGARLTNMRQAVQAIQKSPQAAAAMDGLRSKFNQYFFDHPEQSADMALMAEKSGLYTPEQAANIRKVANDIRGENAQQQAARMVRGGMPALENSSSVANYIVRKVGFIALSGGVGTLMGGPVAGAATGAAALAGQSMIARQKQMTIDAIAKIIQDPKMAKIMAEKPNKSNAFVADHIARQIAADVTRQHAGQDQDQQQ